MMEDWPCEVSNENKRIKSCIRTQDLTEYYKNTDIISVRANKDGLQYCLFEDTGLGHNILNEGCYKSGEVLHFKIKRCGVSKYSCEKIRREGQCQLVVENRVLRDMVKNTNLKCKHYEDEIAQLNMRLKIIYETKEATPPSSKEQIRPITASLEPEDQIEPIFPHLYRARKKKLLKKYPEIVMLWDKLEEVVHRINKGV